MGVAVAVCNGDYFRHRGSEGNQRLKCCVTIGMIRVDSTDFIAGDRPEASLTALDSSFCGQPRASVPLCARNGLPRASQNPRLACPYVHRAGMWEHCIRAHNLAAERALGHCQRPAETTGSTIPLPRGKISRLVRYTGFDPEVRNTDRPYAVPPVRRAPLAEGRGHPGGFALGAYHHFPFRHLRTAGPRCLRPHSSK